MFLLESLDNNSFDPKRWEDIVLKFLSHSLDCIQNNEDMLIEIVTSYQKVIETIFPTRELEKVILYA